MPLSEHEQRLLDEMERSLYHGDGDVVASVGSRGRPPYRSIVLGALIGVVGIAALVVGVFLQSTILGIVGFVVMFAGVLLAIAPSSRASSTTPEEGRPQGAAPGRAQRQGFMDRLGDRWDRREDGHR